MSDDSGFVFDRDEAVLLERKGQLMAIFYEVRGVLAGVSDRPLLKHYYDGTSDKTLCGRVSADHLCDMSEAPPATCPDCTRRFVAGEAERSAQASLDRIAAIRRGEHEHVHENENSFTSLDALSAHDNATIAKLREALEWYANMNTGDSERARAALAQTEKPLHTCATTQTGYGDYSPRCPACLADFAHTEVKK